MHGPTRRGIGLLLLPIWLSACATWRPHPVEPQQFITDQRPGKVRLVLSDSTTMRMRDPRILRDSVVGDQDVGNTNRRVAVAVGDVVQVQTSHLSLGKTLLAGGAIIGGIVIVTLLANASSNTIYY